METLVYTTDEELFQSFRFGNTDALEQIYLRYWSSLMRAACRQLGTYVESKDIVQDVFTSLIQKSSSINIKVSLKAYLFQMLRHRIINNKRNNRIHIGCHNEIFRMNKSENICSDNYEIKEMTAYVNQIICSLPEKCKEVFLLSRETDCSYKDIAERLKISVSTVEKHIIKALKIIKYRLQYRYELN
jgi:RNA polymerase sigma-70 factor (ECF subfamily)